MEEIVRGQATLENLSPPLDSHTSLTTSASCQSGHDALPNIPHKYICLTACFMAKRTESVVRGVQKKKWTRFRAYNSRCRGARVKQQSSADSSYNLR